MNPEDRTLSGKFVGIDPIKAKAAMSEQPHQLQCMCHKCVRFWGTRPPETPISSSSSQAEHEHTDECYDYDIVWDGIAALICKKSEPSSTTPSAGQFNDDLGICAQFRNIPHMRTVECVNWKLVDRPTEPSVSAAQGETAREWLERNRVRFLTGETVYPYGHSKEMVEYLDEVAMLEAYAAHRMSRLVEVARQYGQHLLSCPCSWPECENYTCDCGWAALEKALEE